MDTASVTALAEMLSATSPYGILCVLGIAYWKLSEKKDREIKSLNLRLADIAERQIAAFSKVEAALVSLGRAIEGHGFPGGKTGS